MPSKLCRVGFVYGITNVRNGKVYVGQTLQTVELRWKRHCDEARRGSKKPLHRAIRKYGPKSFNVAQLARITEPLLDITERRFTKDLRSMVPHGYNLDAGGRSGGTQSQALRRKHSLATSAAYARDPTLGERTGSGWRGKHLPVKMRQTISKSQSAWARKPLSEEHRKAIGAASKRSWENADYRTAQIAHQRGRIVSAETCKHISESRRGRTFGPLSKAHGEAISAGLLRYHAGTKTLSSSPCPTSR